MDACYKNLIRRLDVGRWTLRNPDSGKDGGKF